MKKFTGFRKISFVLLAMFGVGFIVSACNSATTGQSGAMAPATNVALTNTTVVAAKASDFVGQYKGHWERDLNEGAANVWVHEQGDGSVKLSFNIDTPGGPLAFEQAPDFDRAKGILINTSKAFKATYRLTNDGMVINYSRFGNAGKYVLKRIKS